MSCQDCGRADSMDVACCRQPVGDGDSLGFAPLYVNASLHWSLMRPGLGFGCGSVFHARHDLIGLHTSILLVGFHPCSTVRSYFQVLTWVLIALGLGAAAVAAVAGRPGSGSKREDSVAEVRRNVAT